MLIVVPLSFSNDSYLVFPPQSWGVRWYAAMFSHDRLLQAFRVSLTIAAVVTVLSLAVGVPAAYALRRWRFPGRDALLSLFTAPLLLPSIVLGWPSCWCSPTPGCWAPMPGWSPPTWSSPRPMSCAS